MTEDEKTIGGDVDLQMKSTEPSEVNTKTTRTFLSPISSTLVILQLGGLSFVTSLTNGILAVAIPQIAADIDLRHSLILWPSSIGYLATSSFLLLGGEISDVTGPKRTNLVGCVFLTGSILAMGRSFTGTELIGFRALQGIAYALAYPSSTAIISLYIEDGPRRNLGFACIGFAMVFGFMSGLFLGVAPWRPAFYATAGFSSLLLLLGILALPSDQTTLAEPVTLKGIRKDIDWVGGGIATAVATILSYVLAMLSADVNNIRKPSTICLLILSVLLIPGFALWMHFQESHHRPALIPNSIWTTNAAFTSLCLMMFLAGAVQNSMEILLSLFFQHVQYVSAIGTSLRILPTSIMGAILNLCTGRLIHRVYPIYPTLGSVLLSSASPLIMAIVNQRWPYWYAEFWAVLLSSLSGDVIYTVGLLVAADTFTKKRQGLAGALFNVFYFLGGSFGLAISNILLKSKSRSEETDGNLSEEIESFRKSFWTLFAMSITSAVICGFGLRKRQKIGTGAL